LSPGINTLPTIHENREDPTPFDKEKNMQFARMTTRWLALLLLLISTSTAAQVPDLKWDKSVVKDVNEAAGLSAKDPVSALMLFKNVATNTKKPKPEQKAWLDQQIAALQPQALAVLQQDYEAASKALDLRGMIFSSATANEIAKDTIKTEPLITETKTKVLAGTSGAGDIWKITNATAVPIKGSYSEGGPTGVNIAPNNGSQLVRVKAHVENISADGDKSYALWALGSLKRILGSIYATSETSRWMDQDFIFLVTPASEMMACSYVMDGSGMATMKITTGSKVVRPPMTVKKGSSMDIDVLFSVPNTATDLRLFILGAAPVVVTKPPEK
jgi:hypothetical protein